MPEPEDQLRRLAAHRAAQVPAYSAPAVLDARRRPVLLIAAAAAVVVALIVAAAVALWPDGDSRSVDVIAPGTTDAPATTVPPITTAPPTTTTALPPPPSCPQGAASTAPQEHTTAVTDVAFRHVQLDANACLDQVSLNFWGEAPSWRATYAPGEVTYAGMGEVSTGPVLVVEVVGASVDSSLADSSGFGAVVGAAPVSDVVSVRRIQGDAIAWGIEVRSERPFEARADGNRIIVDLPAADPRDTTCVHDAGWSLVAPSSWFALFLGDSPCSLFSPSSRFIETHTDAVDGYVTVVPRDLLTVEPSPFEQVLDSRDTVLGGHPATIVDVAHTGEGLFPAGVQSHRTVVRLPTGPITVAVTGVPGPEYDALVAGADEIAASLRAV